MRDRHLLALGVLLTLPAWARDPRLQTAIDLYSAAKAIEARSALDQLAAQPNLSPADRSDVHRYLAASSFAIGALADARAQLVALCRDDPSATLSPAAFPPGLVELANQVREELNRPASPPLAPPAWSLPALAGGAAVALTGAVGIVYSLGVNSAFLSQQSGQPATVTYADTQRVQAIYPLSWLALSVGAVSAGLGAWALVSPTYFVTVSVSVGHQHALVVWSGPL